MSYSERAYFTSDACAHVAEWQEGRWRRERLARAYAAVMRNRPAAGLALALALIGCGRPCVAPPSHAAILADYRATDAADRRAAVDSVAALRGRLDSDIRQADAMRRE